MLQRSVPNKLQRFFYIVSSSLFASILFGVFTGIGAKQIFSLSDDQSVYIISFFAGLISIVFFIPYTSKGFDLIASGKQTWYQRKRGNEIPKWVTFLVLASFTTITFYFLNKWSCCSS